MDHRRTPSRKPYVLPSWFLVLSVVLIIGGAAYLAVDVATDDPSAAAGASSTSTPAADVEPSATPEPSEPSPDPTDEPESTDEPTPEPSPDPEPTPEPTDEPSETPPIARTASVAVFNNTRTSGLAATYSGRVQLAGWTVAAVGNWRGSIASNTVYYPPALEEQGRLLAADLGVGRIMPAVAPMSTDRLTLVLSGPQ